MSRKKITAKHTPKSSNSKRAVSRDSKSTTGPKGSPKSKTKYAMKLSPRDVIRTHQLATQITADIVEKEAREIKTFDGYQNFLSRVGINTNNVSAASTYDFDLISRNRVLLEAAYRGSWIVGVMIDCIAQDMTKAGVDITTTDKSDLKILEKEMTRLQIWRSLGLNEQWARLYGGSCGFLQIKGQDVTTPLDPETVAKGQFLGIAVFDRWQLQPDLASLIQSGPNMGLPEYYQIVSDPRNYGSQPTDEGEITVYTKVHYTRMVRSIGIQLPFYQAITEQLWGESVLERLWDRLISFDNASLSAGQLIDRASLRMVGIEGLREIIAAGGKSLAALEAMFDKVRELQTNEGLTILDKNDEYQTTSYSFAGLSDMMLQKLQELSGAIGAPLIRLIGQLPAGLGGGNGDADLRMYDDNIHALQEAKLRDPLDTIFKVLWRSTYGKPLPNDFNFTFKSLWQPDPKTKAETANTNAQAVNTIYSLGILPAPTALKELKQSSGANGLFSSISEEDIRQAELEPPPMPGQESEESEDDSSEEKKKETKDAWYRFWKR